MLREKSIVTQDRLSADIGRELKRKIVLVFKNATNPHSKGRVLEESQLREGELSASNYQVGYYSVRIAERVYRNGNFEPSSDDEIRLEGKGVKQGEAVADQSADIPPLKSRYSRPATKDELEEYRNATKNVVFGNGFVLFVLFNISFKLGVTNKQNCEKYDNNNIDDLGSSVYIFYIEISVDKY